METENNSPPFVFARDTFAYDNELLCEYQFDAVTGGLRLRPRRPRPEYVLRCFVLVRAARQFFYHARFDPAGKIPDDATGRRLVRAVLASDPRTVGAPENKIVIPGSAGLREFSAAWEKLLKQECGGAWQSYFLRSHWRMVFPVSRAHQQRTVTRLLAELRAGRPPIIHLISFPSLAINHGMILFAAQAKERAVEFSAYDPNHSAEPVPLTFDCAAKTFSLPANRYWPGGKLNIIEIFRNWLM
jgi:hypothetical protein